LLQMYFLHLTDNKECSKSQYILSKISMK